MFVVLYSNGAPFTMDIGRTRELPCIEDKGK